MLGRRGTILLSFSDEGSLLFLFDGKALLSTDNRSCKSWRALACTRSSAERGAICHVHCGYLGGGLRCI